MTITSANPETTELVKAVIDTTFTWDYDRTRPALGKLYEKAKTSQWNVTTDLDWSTDVDPEKVAAELSGGTTMRFRALQEVEDSPVKHFGDKEWSEVGVQMQNSLLSQFLHGEQGSAAAPAPRIVETVPWIRRHYRSTGR